MTMLTVGRIGNNMPPLRWGLGPMTELAKRLRWLMAEMPARAVAPSFRASYRYSRDTRAALDFPVVAGPSSRLTRHRDSVVKLGGVLFLGYAPPEGGRGRPQMGAA